MCGSLSIALIHTRKHSTHPARSVCIFMFAYIHAHVYIYIYIYIYIYLFIYLYFRGDVSVFLSASPVCSSLPPRAPARFSVRRRAADLLGSGYRVERLRPFWAHSFGVLGFRAGLGHVNAITRNCKLLAHYRKVCKIRQHQAHWGEGFRLNIGLNACRCCQTYSLYGSLLAVGTGSNQNGFRAVAKLLLNIQVMLTYYHHASHSCMLAEVTKHLSVLRHQQNPTQESPKLNYQQVQCYSIIFTDEYGNCFCF